MYNERAEGLEPTGEQYAVIQPLFLKKMYFYTGSRCYQENHYPTDGHFSFSRYIYPSAAAEGGKKLLFSKGRVLVCFSPYPIRIYYSDRLPKN